MANLIRLKTGSGPPSSLEAGEPAFDLVGKGFYIGTGSEVNRKSKELTLLFLNQIPIINLGVKIYG